MEVLLHLDSVYLYLTPSYYIERFKLSHYSSKLATFQLDPGNQKQSLTVVGTLFLAWGEQVPFKRRDIAWASRS